MDKVKWQVINGNNIDILKTYADNTFDSIVTDPPYGIAFLGKDWDNDTGAMETWQECFRVLKPGGHILAFSAARTYHHLATNIEMAGFEIRDQLQWLYGSGFPKAQDIGKAIDKRAGAERKIIGVSKNDRPKSQVKNGMGFDRMLDDGQEHQTIYETEPATPEAQQWAGWKTALKPAHEPIVMARKPFSGSCIDNILEWGTGAMNIDASRIPADDVDNVKAFGSMPKNKTDDGVGFTRPWMKDKQSVLDKQNAAIEKLKELGRYPSNVIMDAEAGAILDEQAPRVGNASSSKRTKTGMTGTGASLQWHKEAGESNGISDGLSGASKFFYCPKVSRKERHIGFEKIPYQGNSEPGGMYGPNQAAARKNQSTEGNNHPTVKPVELMKYLIKLVTPAGGKVLDPFNGSGSTGMAAVELGYEYVGCELDPDYVEIANNRISAWEKRFDTPANKLFEEIT